MKILALDLGTKTGIAMNYGQFPGAQTIKLATKTEVTLWGKHRLTRRCDPRIARLCRELLKIETPDMVVFEDVEFSTYTYQTQLWASLRAAVWIAFDQPSVAIECVPVTVLKKFATGNGGAKKEAMSKAMFTQFPQTRPDLDDNAIDALWILKWAERNLSRMKV